MSFRDNLQHLRAMRNMTQEQLAMLLGVSRQSVTKWEAEKSYPEMDKLIKVCQIFECSLDDLVQGDLTDSAPVPDAKAVPAGPATDVCGYGEHMRRFARRVPAGVAAFVLGVVGLVLFEEGTALRGLFNSGMAASWGEFLGLGALFAGVLVGVGILVSAGMEHSAFVKAHPFIEDFYTDEDRLQARQVLVRGLVAGLMFIMMGILLGNFIEHESGAEAPAGAALLALVALGVWLIVYAGMMYGRMDIDEYNRDAVEELEVEDIARIDVPRRCGPSCAPLSARIRRSRLRAVSSCSSQLLSPSFGCSWVLRSPGPPGAPLAAVTRRRTHPPATSGSPGWSAAFCVESCRLCSRPSTASDKDREAFRFLTSVLGRSAWDSLQTERPDMPPRRLPMAPGDCL